MKKYLNISLKSSLIIAMLASTVSAKYQLEFIPIDNKYLSKTNGGNMSEVEAYRDGVGIYVVNKDISNKEMHDNLFKYGEIANNEGIPLDEFISKTNPNLAKLIPILKKNGAIEGESGEGETVPGFNVGESCNDNNDQTIDDKIDEDGICVGIKESNSIKCEGEEIGSEFSFGGEIYIVADDNSISDIVASGEYPLKNICTSNVTEMDYLFNSSDMDLSGISNWDISNVTSLFGMFSWSSFNGDISEWDTSKVTHMTYMFQSTPFNGDISEWNTSKVEDMYSMFDRASFNGDISKWNVSSVRDMYSMFNRASFNGDISKWNVSSVRDMRNMFNSASFNGDISKWNVSSVEDMSNMFSSSSFNGDISKWNVSSVENMRNMFYESSFNGDISEWNVSSVRDMYSMFNSASFNGDISKWNVSSVEDMSSMFSWSSFNNDISKWNVSSVEDMADMFQSTPFNGDISEWNTSKVTRMSGMFYESSFNGDISKWKTSKVTNMDYMFQNSPFNNNLNAWCVENIQWEPYAFNSGSFEYSNHPKWGEPCPVKDVEVKETVSCLDKTIGSTFELNGLNYLVVSDSTIRDNLYNENICTSHVTDMSNLFYYNNSFENITSWDTSNVVNMENIFKGSKFNQDISNWNVSKVEIMSGSFYGTTFNKDISKWDVSKVNNMDEMFANNYKFNSNLSDWCVVNVEERPNGFSYYMDYSNLPIWGACPGGVSPYGNYGLRVENGVLKCDKGLGIGKEVIIEEDTEYIPAGVYYIPGNNDLQYVVREVAIIGTIAKGDSLKRNDLNYGYYIDILDHLSGFSPAILNLYYKVDMGNICTTNINNMDHILDYIINGPSAS